MNRLLIAATISVAALVLMFAPSADAGGFGGNQVFIQSSPFGFQRQVVVQSAPRVFVQRSFGSQVVIQNGHAFSGNRVFVQQRPQVQVNVNRGFGLFNRRQNVRVFVR